MSDRVALRRTTALGRIAIAGVAAAFLGGCSADALRLDSLKNTITSPFSSLTGGEATGSVTPSAGTASAMRGAALNAGRSNFAAAAASAPVGSVTKFQPPVTGGERGWSVAGGTPLVVANGETVSALSQRYGVPESALLSANGFSSASQVTPGTRLTIPVFNAGAARAAAAAPVAAATSAAPRISSTPLASPKVGPDPDVARHIADAKAAKARAEEDRLRLAKAREDARQAQLKLEQEKRQAALDARSRADTEKMAARKAEVARLETRAKEMKAAEAAQAERAAARKAEQKLAERKALEARASEKKELEAKLAKLKADESKTRAAAAKTKAEELSREARAKEQKARELKLGKQAAAKPAPAKAQKLAAAEPAETKPETTRELPKVARQEPTRSEQTRTEVARSEPAKPEPAKPETTASLKPETEKEASTSAAAGNPEFRWPARGRVIQGFRANGNDGINIAVPEGTPVKAAEGGVVAYAGSELKNLGNLVLIRHPNGYVSAYAHNGALNVKRGEQIKRGQVIATSGQSGSVQTPQLHFELRKGSTPVDPTQYLAGL